MSPSEAYQLIPLAERAYPIAGHRIRTMITDEEGVKFLSEHHVLREEFLRAWRKKFSIATKVNIRYDRIRRITREEQDKNVKIRYRTALGISPSIVFAFLDADDAERFFHFFQQQHFYNRTTERLSRFAAVRDYLFGLLFTIAITGFAYWQAIEIRNGTVEKTSDAKSELFNLLVAFLGPQGVLAVGGAICLVIMYQVYKRGTNPPLQMHLTPPNR